MTKCVRFERFGCKCPRPRGLLLGLAWLVPMNAMAPLWPPSTQYWQSSKSFPPVENYASRGRQKCAQLQQHQQQKRAAHKKKCEMEKHIKRKTEKTLSHTHTGRQIDRQSHTQHIKREHCRNFIRIQLAARSTLTLPSCDLPIGGFIEKKRKKIPQKKKLLYQTSYERHQNDLHTCTCAVCVCVMAA